jgi:integrase
MPTIEKLNESFVSKARAPEGKVREFFWETTTPGFGLQVMATGHKSFVLQYRCDGISRRLSINGGRTLAQARREAKDLLGKIAKGGDPLSDKRNQRDARKDTLRRIIEDEYLADDDVKKLRSIDHKRGTFRRYIFPMLGTRPIAEIKRSEIVRMLRKIKQTAGPGAADNAFKVLSRFFSWYIPLADDDFVSPIVRGTWSQTQGEGARVLVDDEIRILWRVASEGKGPYDHFLKFTLLTATRLKESAQMTWNELSLDRLEWTIPEHRYKGQDGKSAHAHLIPLSPLAREVLAGVPVLQGRGGWVFTNFGRTPITAGQHSKSTMDARLQAALDAEGEATRARIIADLDKLYPGRNYQPFDDRWTTHSLRKTARTLLSRAKIDTHTAEKCLGHVEPGIRGRYNHHDFKAEKRTAFEALAREIERIVEGGSANVIPLARA